MLSRLAKRGVLTQSILVEDKKWTVLLASVPEDGAEVACGSRGHKQVPDEVAVSDPLGEVEHDSRGVGEPSGCDPEQSFQGYMKPKLADGEHCHPTHTDI